MTFLFYIILIGIVLAIVVAVAGKRRPKAASATKPQASVERQPLTIEHLLVRTAIVTAAIVVNGILIALCAHGGYDYLSTGDLFILALIACVLLGGYLVSLRSKSEEAQLAMLELRTALLILLVELLLYWLLSYFYLNTDQWFQFAAIWLLATFAGLSVVASFTAACIGYKQDKGYKSYVRFYSWMFILGLAATLFGWFIYAYVTGFGKGWGH